MRVVALIALAGAVFAMSAQAAQITGTATYLARIAPPPGSVFEAILEDVSRADAPSVRLGSVALDGVDGPPYRFAIPYDPAALDPRMRYAVRATLRRPDGRPMFVTAAQVPVLTAGAGDAVEIVMVSASGEDRPLIGPIWRLTGMGDAPVTAEGQREAPHLAFDEEGGAFGSGGCNRLRGGYEAGADGALSFGAIASTMMACPKPAMRLERAFADMLERIEAFEIAGDRLTLYANDAPLAVFTAE